MYPFSSNSSPDQKQEPIYPIFMANFMCDGGPYDVASLDVIHAALHSHLISKLDKLKSIKFSRTLEARTRIHVHRARATITELTTLQLLKLLAGNHVSAKQDLRAIGFLNAYKKNAISDSIKAEEVWWFLAEDFIEFLTKLVDEFKIPLCEQVIKKTQELLDANVAHDNNLIMNLFNEGKDKEALIFARELPTDSTAVKTVPILANKLKKRYYFDYAFPTESETKMNQQEPVLTPIKDENGKHKGTMKQYTAVLESPMDLVTLVNALDSMGIKTTSIVKEGMEQLILSEKEELDKRYGSQDIFKNRSAFQPEPKEDSPFHRPVFAHLEETEIRCVEIVFNMMHSVLQEMLIETQRRGQGPQPYDVINQCHSFTQVAQYIMSNQKFAIEFLLHIRINGTAPSFIVDDIQKCLLAIYGRLTNSNHRDTFLCSLDNLIRFLKLKNHPYQPQH